MKKYYKDKSAFYGWYEFETPTSEFRAERVGRGIYRVSERVGDGYGVTVPVKIEGRYRSAVKLFMAIEAAHDVKMFLKYEENEQTKDKGH